MNLSPEQRLHQARSKMRIIAAREMRDFRSGKAQILRGCWQQRETLDAIAKAYEAGLRDGREAQHT